MDPRQLQLLASTQRSHQVFVARTRENVTRAITSRWLSMERWRGDDMTAFKNAVIPLVLSAERQVAQLTNTYLTAMDNIATGSDARAEPLELSEVTGAALRNGIEPTAVYSRPEAAVNAALSRGSSVSVAVSEGLRRALSLSMTDLQLAKTHTVARQGRGSWFWRELNGPKNCAKCVIASTQRYTRGNLLPIHPGCDCGIREEHTRDPGQVINRSLLEATNAAIEDFTGSYDRTTLSVDPSRYLVLDGKKLPMRGNSTDALDYTDVIIIREHGEYGPTLAWRDENFTAKDDLAA